MLKLSYHTNLFEKEAVFLMSRSITQDMACRQSLMKYAEKYGVGRASRNYSKSRSYIYFRKERRDGSAASPACRSGRPHSRPNQHTAAGLKLICGMRRRNPTLGMIELWHRLRQRGYTRCPASLFRVMRKMGIFPAEKPKKAYKPMPYGQKTHPGERVQVDVKVVPRSCIADSELRLFQYAAIDEFTRLRFLAAYPKQSACSYADFLRRLTAWYARRRIKVESVQTDNGFEFTNRFPTAGATCRRCLKEPLPNWAFVISSSAPTPHATTARQNAATVRIRNASIPATTSTLWMTLQSSLPSITDVPTAYP